MIRKISLLVLLFLVVLGACQTRRLGTPPQPGLEVLWQRADSLERLALPKSALAVADSILQQSRQQQRTNDYIKGLLYRIRMNEHLYDDAVARNISELETEVAQLWVPARQLAHSILGDLYQTYYQQNRWYLLEEAAAVSGSSRLSDWTALELGEKARQHYRLSLSDRAVLASEPSEHYLPLLLEGEEKLYLRPSLYDLLVERTLRVFLSEELYELPGAVEVDWTQEALLQERARFLAMDLAVGDSMSLQAEGLTLLQEWLQFRQHEASTELWCDVDLLRLELLYPLYEGDKGEELYEQRLCQLAHEVEGSPAQARVLYRYAAFLRDQTYSRDHAFRPNGPERNWLGEAHGVALQIQREFPETEAARLAAQLQSELERPELQLETSGLGLPDAPLDYQVSYVNVDSLHTALFALEQPDLSGLNQPDEAWVWQQLGKKSPLHRTAIALPFYDDYLAHKAALRLDRPLPYGLYALVVSDTVFNAKEPLKNGLFKYALVQITSMSLLQMQMEEQLSLAVRNRQTGRGMGPVQISCYERGAGEKAFLVETSSEGDVNLPWKREGGRQARFRLQKGADIFFSPPVWLGYYNERVLHTELRHFVVTDRAVYRPGQTVHYKVVAMERDTSGLVRVREGEAIELALYDVNNRELSRHPLKTNAYGSASGSFVLPQGPLSGDFSLRTPHGATSVLVEAVKRPRFQVEVLPLQGQARLGDTVVVTARAELLNGLPLADAEVAWRVQSGYGYWRGRGAQKPLAAGRGRTNEAGEVEISFVALGAAAASPFDFGTPFLVEADVTAPGGETRSGSGSVLLSRHGGSLSLGMDRSFTAAQLKQVPVRVSLQNLSGQDLDGSVAYTLEALKVAAPDYRVQADTFLYALPERAPQEQVLRQLAQGQLEVQGSSEHLLHLKQALAEGYYRLSLSWIEVGGDTLRAQSRFTVLDPGVATYGLSEPLSLVQAGSPQLSPGQLLEFRVASVYSGVQAQVLVHLDGELLYNKPQSLNGKWETLRVPLPAHRSGPLQVQVFLPHHNRQSEAQLNLQVVDTSDRLELSLSAPEGPLLPGSAQRWQLKLRDAKGQPVSAELLALLYDGALDLYRSHSLPTLGFNPPYRPFPRWDSSGAHFSFQGGRSLPYGRYISEAPYPAFLWTRSNNFSFGRGQGPLMKSAAVAGVLNIVDDDVSFAEELAIFDSEAGYEEEIIPLTRQEEVAPLAPPSPEGPMPIRSNLKETAFFLPHLLTNEKGEADFDFTLPESLTSWRFLALAHTRDGRSVDTRALRVSRKDLMVLPQWPRLVREGDELYLTARILNNSSHQLGGMARLEVRDALSGRSLMLPGLDALSWEAEAGAATLVEWRLKVPEGLRGMELAFSAVSGQSHDGEQQVVAVLPARTLVTETRPYFFTKAGAYQLELPTLTEGEGQDFERFTLTYTENAAWEVLGALPWLQEQAYDNADQVFNRYFAATLAQEIFKQQPQIERLLKAWASLPPEEDSAWESTLERQPELKAALLTATPWLREAESDAERRRRLSALVAEGGLDRVRYEALQSLEALQLPNGAWPWFQGMHPSSGTTLQIVEGFSYLERLGAESGETAAMLNRAQQWLLKELVDQQARAERLPKEVAGKMEAPLEGVSPLVVRQVHSLSGVAALRGDSTLLFWVDRLEKQPPYEHMALLARSLQILHRFGRSAAAEVLQASLQEHLLEGEGTAYFKIPAGPYWYQAPVETQVWALEALREAVAAPSVLAAMENWLVQQKRSQHWRSTRATVAAVYALASSERPLFESDGHDVLKVNGEALSFESSASGSGFRSLSLQGSAITPAYGRITLEKYSDTPSYASLMLSRFEPDSLVEAGGFLTVERQLLKRVLVGTREQWLPVGDSLEVTPGDRLMVRVVLESPQALDFVHLHLPRASLLEPANPLSGYRYAQGLGYYLSLTDAGADVFVDHLPRGRFSLTFELNATLQGRASEGPARVQCFYAPEFGGYSKGGTINVKKGKR